MVTTNVGEKDDRFTIRVSCKEKKGYYRLQSVWDGENIKLIILDETSAFKSFVSSNVLKQQALDYTVNYEDYIKKVLFSLQSEETNNYLYERKDETFYIFRQHRSMNIQLAAFKLEKMNYIEAVENFIDNMKDMTMVHRSRMEKLENEKKIAVQEKKAAIEKLDTYVNLKEETEHDLYSRFILILNEKKKRIEHLNEIVEAYKDGKIHSDYDSDDSSESKPEYILSKKNIVKRLEMISDSDTDTEPENIQRVTHTVQIEPEPSMSSKRKISLDEDTIPNKLKKDLHEEFDLERNFQSDNDNISVVSTSSFDSDISPPFKNSLKNNKNSITIEQCESQNVVEENKVQIQSSESPEFNTQDLMDRL